MNTTSQLLGVAGYFVLMASALFFLLGWRKQATNPVAGRRWLMGGVVVAVAGLILLIMAL